MSSSVISASRRTDMVGTAAERMIEVLRARHPPSQVHTLVVWTKAPSTLLANTRLVETISGYNQLFFHCTVTGMGGTRLEPGSPSLSQSLGSLGGLVNLAGSAERVRVRFDPVVYLVLPGGRRYSNLHHFAAVGACCAKLGISTIVTSWMQCYPKVRKRLERAGVGIDAVSAARARRDTEFMQDVCSKFNLKLLGCCAAHLPSSSCVDGDLFNRLHPLGHKCSVAKARGQRLTCTCSVSLDIGWYTPCAHGCLYCYANPSSLARNEGKPWPE